MSGHNTDSFGTVEKWDRGVKKSLERARRSEIGKNWQEQDSRQIGTFGKFISCVAKLAEAFRLRLLRRIAGVD
jgi:hypothetical protein